MKSFRKRALSGALLITFAGLIQFTSGVGYRYRADPLTGEKRLWLHVPGGRPKLLTDFDEKPYSGPKNLVDVNVPTNRNLQSYSNPIVKQAYKSNNKKSPEKLQQLPSYENNLVESRPVVLAISSLPDRSNSQKQSYTRPVSKNKSVRKRPNNDVEGYFYPRPKKPFLLPGESRPEKTTPRPYFVGFPDVPIEENFGIGENSEERRNKQAGRPIRPGVGIFPTSNRPSTPTRPQQNPNEFQPRPGTLPRPRPSGGGRPLPRPRPGSGNLPRPRPGSGNIPRPRPESGNLPRPRPGSGNLPSPRPESRPSPRPSGGGSQAGGFNQNRFPGEFETNRNFISGSRGSGGQGNQRPRPNTPPPRFPDSPRPTFQGNQGVRNRESFFTNNAGGFREREFTNNNRNSGTGNRNFQPNNPGFSQPPSSRPLAPSVPRPIPPDEFNTFQESTNRSMTSMSTFSSNSSSFSSSSSSSGSSGGRPSSRPRIPPLRPSNFPSRFPDSIPPTFPNSRGNTFGSNSRGVSSGNRGFSPNSNTADNNFISGSSGGSFNFNRVDAQSSSGDGTNDKDISECGQDGLDEVWSHRLGRCINRNAARRG